MSGTPARLFDHIAFAVRSLEDAVALFRDVLGATFVSGGDDDTLDMRTMQYILELGTKIELLMPLTEDCGLARFIEKHGEGFHHATFFFDDIEALLPELDRAGLETTGTNLADRGWRETYLRPKSGFGSLFQFVDTNLDWNSPIPGVTEEDVLLGRLVWKGHRPVFREGDA